MRAGGEGGSAAARGVPGGRGGDTLSLSNVAGLPDVVVQQTKDKARMHLERCGVVPSAGFAGRTVRGVVQEMLRFHGVRLDELGSTHHMLDAVARTLLAALRETDA